MLAGTRPICDAARATSSGITFVSSSVSALLTNTRALPRSMTTSSPTTSFQYPPFASANRRSASSFTASVVQIIHVCICRFHCLPGEIHPIADRFYAIACRIHAARAGGVRLTNDGNDRRRAARRAHNIFDERFRVLVPRGAASRSTFLADDQQERRIGVEIELLRVHSFLFEADSERRVKDCVFTDANDVRRDDRCPFISSHDDPSTLPSAPTMTLRCVTRPATIE